MYWEVYHSPKSIVHACIDLSELSAEDTKACKYVFCWWALLIIGSSDQDSEVCDDKALKLYRQIELFGQTGTEF